MSYNNGSINTYTSNAEMKHYFELRKPSIDIDHTYVNKIENAGHYNMF